MVERLRELLKSRKLSNRVISEKTGMLESKVSRMLSGDSATKMDDLLQILGVLGDITPNELYWLILGTTHTSEPEAKTEFLNFRINDLKNRNEYLEAQLSKSLDTNILILQKLG